MPTMMIDDDDVRPLQGWARPSISPDERHEREQEITCLRYAAASPRVTAIVARYLAVEADRLADELARELERGTSR